MKPFQVVVLIIFGFFAVGGVLFFSVYKGGSNQVTIGKVAIWGTLPKELVDTLVRDLGKKSDTYKGIKYTELPEATFSDEYVRALAEGRGPDLILLPHTALYERLPTLKLIPYDSLSERDFKNTYIEATEIYLQEDGIAGIPFTVDPLVTYWNRSLLSSKGVAKPPQYWSEYYELAPKLTEKDELLKIKKSTVALGEFMNIRNAKDVLASMILQSGHTIAAPDSQGNMSSILHEKLKGQSVAPVQSALLFFTEFSDPRKAVYSWNRGLPEAQQAFISGDLALYFGFASEVKAIRDANPNLNYDVTSFPQSKGSSNKAVFANMTAFAIPRGSKNTGGAFQAALALTSTEEMRLLTKTTGLPPVRRDLLAEDPKDPYLTLFYEAALISKAWLDPNPRESATIFKNMSEAITSGRLGIGEAVLAGSQQLNLLFK